MKTARLIVCLLLWPLTMWYAIIVAIRNWMYDCGLKRSARTAIPTIGIGNLRMGGTGKTPHTEYLIRRFADRHVALLSRGYGRTTQGFLLANGESTAAQIGDEPSMMARKFPTLTVAVCEDRNEGVRRMAQMPLPPSLVLLDDVYQHRSTHPDVQILLTEYGDPYFNDRILPFGNLRELRSGSRRADIIVVTKCPPMLSLAKRTQYQRRLKLHDNQQLFFSQIDYQPPVPLYDGSPWQPVKEVLLVTGIAHPAPLKHHLEKQCTVVAMPFPDHHTFTQSDCQHIRKAFSSMEEKSKVIVTTEKDAMRLLNPDCRSALQDLPIFFIPIAVSIIDSDRFDETLRSLINGSAASRQASY